MGRSLSTTLKRSKPAILDFNFPNRSSKSRAIDISEKVIRAPSDGPTRVQKALMIPSVASSLSQGDSEMISEWEHPFGMSVPPGSLVVNHGQGSKGYRLSHP